jgi:Spy/CpxP family protein refolding chaperone
MKGKFGGSDQSETGGKPMKPKALMTGLVAGSMVLAVAFVAQARPFGPSFSDQGIGAGVGRLEALLELKLSENQRAQLIKIINKYEEQRKGFRNRMIEARKNLWGVLKAANFNEENARKAFREASAVREDMFVLRAKMMSEMKSLLTPEQLQLLQEGKAQRYERMKDNHARPENPKE